MPMEAGRTIPKFGAWDVNNPSSADGFTVIFGKARDEKKAPATVPGPGKLQYNKINRPTDDIKDARAERINPSYNNSSSSSSSARANGSKKWFCCVSPSPTQP